MLHNCVLGLGERQLKPHCWGHVKSPPAWGSGIRTPSRQFSCYWVLVKSCPRCFTWPWFFWLQRCLFCSLVSGLQQYFLRYCDPVNLWWGQSWTGMLVWSAVVRNGGNVGYVMLSCRKFNLCRIGHPGFIHLSWSWYTGGDPDMFHFLSLPPTSLSLGTATTLKPFNKNTYFSLCLDMHCRVSNSNTGIWGEIHNQTTPNGRQLICCYESAIHPLVPTVTK